MTPLSLNSHQHETTEATSEQRNDTESKPNFYPSIDPCNQTMGIPPNCTDSTVGSTATSDTKYDPSSLSTVTPVPSLASRRSRLLPVWSPQITALLQNAKKRQFANVSASTSSSPNVNATTNTNTRYDHGSEVSSLISDSSYSVSLDDDDMLLPSAKTTTFQLTTDLELDDDNDNADEDEDENENENEDGLDAAKIEPCGEKLTIVTSVHGNESVSKPEVQQPKIKEHMKHHHARLHALKSRRKQNKRHRQHEHPNNSDSMSTISNITFDFNTPSAPPSYESTSVDTHKVYIFPTPSNSSYLQKLSDHYHNISTTTNNHPTIDAKKTQRLESIHDRIMLLQTENHNVKAANKRFSKHFSNIQDPDTIKLIEMHDRVKAVEMENHDLRARNLDLEAEVKQQGLLLLERESLSRQNQQRLSLVPPSPRNEEHAVPSPIPLSYSHQPITSNGATLIDQQKEIELQRKAYMNTRKRLEDKRKLCRDMLASCRGQSDTDSVSGSKGCNDVAVNTALGEDDEEDSFLSSSMSLSLDDHDTIAEQTTDDRVKKAHAMLSTQKQYQLEQEVAVLHSKINTLQEINGNLLRKFQEHEDDYCSVTKMETSSIQQQEEISTLKRQLKQKNNACTSMEHELIGVRTEMMDLKDMHEFEVRQMKKEYNNMKAEAGRLVDWLKNQLTIYQRKLHIQDDGDREGGMGLMNCYSGSDSKYEDYGVNNNAGSIKGKTSTEMMSTMVENQNIMAEIYHAKQYVQDAHNEAAKVGDGVVDTEGMEGLSKKEQEDLVAEIAEERKKWVATTSPPITPKALPNGIPMVVSL